MMFDSFLKIIELFYIVFIGILYKYKKLITNVFKALLCIANHEQKTLKITKTSNPNFKNVTSLIDEPITQYNRVEYS